MMELDIGSFGERVPVSEEEDTAVIVSPMLLLTAPTESTITFVFPYLAVIWKYGAILRIS